MTDFKGLQNFTRIGVEHRDGSAFLRCHIDQFSVGRNFDPLRLSADLRGFQYRSRSNVHHAYRGIILVRNVELRSVLAYVKILRIGTSLDDSNNLLLRDVENTDTIRALIGRRQSALIDIRTGDRRSAES